ncbi:hypothetical protein TorRG33x02_237610, partial [Trema orientale]
ICRDGLTILHLMNSPFILLSHDPDHVLHHSQFARLLYSDTRKPQLFPQPQGPHHGRITER